ncbi:MAG: elongation factor G [Actinobacteria bacterium]|nr:elongation factor G [Actinomycetota bacterium]
MSLSIKNFGLFGHGGSGKTTLAESILFTSGVLTRMGDVEQGNTAMDFDEDEIKRTISINCAIGEVSWNSTELQIIDTPGYADFIGDALSATRVADTFLFVISGVDGVEVQTEILWEKADESDSPRAIFISKLDRERSSFQRTLDDIKETFEANIVPVFVPVGEEHEFKGIYSLLKGKAYASDGQGKTTEITLPGDMEDDVASLRESMIEAVAESSDELIEKYLEEGDLSDDEIDKGLREGLKKGALVPVLCGSASSCAGVFEVMDFISEYFPGPEDMPGVKGVNSNSGEEIEIPRKEDGPMAALIFKTLADPYVGKLTYFKVFSGVFKSDSTVLNSSKKKSERVGQLFKVNGKEQKPVGEIRAGELGSVAKLSDSFTGDTLCAKENPILLPGIEYPAPLMSIAIEPKTKGDEDKLSTALSRISEEDPMLRVRRDTEVHQTIISGAGENHLDVTVDKMHRKFGVEVQTETPKVPYKETIRKTIESEGKHKKQTGGHGQFGHCFLRIEPLERGSGYQFADAIVGGAIPKNYIPGVEKGVIAAMEDGFIAGYPVVDVRITLYDGSFHSVDSSELAFKMAAMKAMREGSVKADPVLLEPIANLHVTVPDSYTGDIIGDLNSKRGRILGMEPKGKMQVVSAQVPMAELSRYSIDLRSITGGRGIFQVELSHYEEVPDHITKKIVEDHKKEAEEA